MERSFRLVPVKAVSFKDVSQDEDSPSNNEALVRKAMAGATLASQKLNEAPLMTSSMRQEQIDAKNEKLKEQTVKIRFKLPGEQGFMIETAFQGSESLLSLYTFLEQLFEQENPKFKLRILRPVRYLERTDNRMIGLCSLYPASCLHVIEELESGEAAQGKPSSKWCINNAFRERFKDRILPEPEPVPEPTSEAGGSQTGNHQKHGHHSRRDSLKKAIPKWMKLGSKK